ncbi:MAG TPA: SAM-dependent methyltransferase [Myxococcales bacterium]|nr:SAM-dependent methyltransferase [Myxococcales bacterium]
MNPPLIHDVSDTAFFVAHYRALEGSRPDALFHDPLAERLAGERGRRIGESMKKALLGGWSIAIRTVIIDGYIGRAVAEGVDTVLNLGAGLDTRPYRMELPGALRWIEVDFPHVIELKETELAAETPRCRLERVRLDLGDVAARRAFLRGLGAKKLLVLTEGVTPYLSNEQVAELAKDLREIGAALWVVDYFNHAVTRTRRRAAIARHLRNAPFRFDPADWFAFFAKAGWRCREIRYILEEAERLRRRPRLNPLLVLGLVLRGVFMTRQKRAAARRFMGFALMEPA